MRKSYLLVLLIAAMSTFAGWQPEDYIEGFSDKKVYGPGEKMTFTLDVRGFEGLNKSTHRLVWARTGDDGRTEKGEAPADRSLVLTTSLDRPGFVRYYVELRDDSNKVVERAKGEKKVFFDGGAGVDILKIRPAVPEPKDFDAFWVRHRKTLDGIPWKDAVRTERLESGRDDIDLYAVTVPCAGGRPVTGFLSVPIAAQTGKRFPARIMFFGYSASWRLTGKPAPGKMSPDWISFELNAHGCELMRDAAYYADQRRKAGSNGKAYAFDPVQNADPETAYFCGMTYRVMRALDYLKSRPEWDGRRLQARGGSMGGLQTIWAAALDPAVTEALPDIPWCCDIGGTEVGRNRGTWYVQWVPALGYYDPVNMARRIPKSCTVNVTRAGLGDYVCPPTGVMAFYNNLTCPKRIRLVQNSTHGYVAPPPYQTIELQGCEIQAGQQGIVRIAASELDKYVRQITGGRTVRAQFRVDPKLDARHDEYRIVSTSDGVRFVGANDRALLYAVYDFLERRGGCRWFWDGDVVPSSPSVDTTGLDIREKSRFEYRATRYFAHRGLTRFQAEQWGLDDWKKEIDWLLKARLNVFFLRVGMDDLFQKAFPEYCSYPDPSKPLPGQGKGYDNRHLFWSLEYRGKLRHDLQTYAFERGLIIPEDFGTITHWYTRTPEDFIENAKPDFLKEPHSEYGYSAQKSGCVWDVMQDKWMEAYWKLTETSMREYGRPGYLHTIGFSERTMSTNRAENLAIKQATTKRMFDRALKAQPDAKIFFAGWDFHSTWTPEEIRAYLPTLDPKHVVVWDYEWDAYRPKLKSGQFSVPTEWGLVGGKIPYTFGQFFYYRATFPHTAYGLVAERFAQVKDDPACVGYILWPEASHTDILQLKDFADNAWRPVDRTTDELVDTFCRDRYGDQAAAFAAIWKDVIPISVKAKGNGRWGATYGTAMIHTFANEPSKNADGVTNRVCWAGRFFPDADFAAAPKVFSRLADLRWEDPMAQRDAIDLARTVGDRLALDAFAKAMLAYFDWRDGVNGMTVETVRTRFARAQAYVRLMARTLALHTDYSLCDSYDRLNAIEPIRYPGFGRTLIDNTMNFYCAAHQAELAEHVYVPMFDCLVDQVEDRLAKGDRKTPLSSKLLRDIEDKVRETPLMDLRLTTPRTAENYCRTMLDWKGAAR